MSTGFGNDVLTAGWECFADVGSNSTKITLCAMTVCGCGSLMVWAGITAHGRTDLVFVNETLNAQKYRQDILACYIVLFIRANGGMFQQDNACPQVARDIWAI